MCKKIAKHVWGSDWWKRTAEKLKCMKSNFYVLYFQFYAYTFMFYTLNVAFSDICINHIWEILIGGDYTRNKNNRNTMKNSTAIVQAWEDYYLLRIIGYRNGNYKLKRNLREQKLYVSVYWDLLTPAYKVLCCQREPMILIV